MRRRRLILLFLVHALLFFFNPRLHSHLSLMQGTHLNVTRSIMWPAKERQTDVSYKRALSGRSERLNDFFFPFPEPSHRLSLHSGDNVPHVLPCLFALSSLPLCVEDIQLFLPLCASVCLGSCLCLSTHWWGKKTLCSFGWKWPTVLEVTSVAS